MPLFYLDRFFTEPPDEEFFRQQARQFGFEEEAYLKAMRDIPVVEEEKIGQSDEDL